MEQDLGPKKTKALDKYMGVVSLTKPQAKEILVAVFPEAPEAEIARAVLLCASYGLNPLMKHCFLIPFNKGKENESWATVIGIKAKRLLASRRGNYSYVGNTPRVMTKREQEAIFGEVYDDRIVVITKVKDPATGAEAPGYGTWPKTKINNRGQEVDNQPHGTEKGNSKFNMAAIRSESQALDRLRPGEMPEGIEVVPEEAAEAAIEGEYTITEESPDTPPASEPAAEEPKPKQHWCEEHQCTFELKKKGTSTWYAHQLAGGGWCNEAKKKEAQPELTPEPAPEPEPEPAEEAKPIIDLEWLKESLETLRATKLQAWTESNLLGYMKTTYNVEAETVLEATAKLDKGQAAHFIKRVQETLDMA